MRILLPAAAALALIASPASAQVVGGGLVNVNISDVAIDIADALDVNVQDVIDIGNIQVPIGIAANICPNVNAAVLAAQRNESGPVSCEATNTTTALNRMVQKELNKNKQ